MRSRQIDDGKSNTKQERMKEGDPTLPLAMGEGKS